MTTDLVTWLRQQLDEDEVTTRELLYWAQQTILTLQDPKLLGKHIPGWHDWPKVERMCRVRLAELDAKRRILTRFEYRLSMQPDEAADPRDWDDLTRHYYETVRDLAEPYADRGGYREEWRP